MYDINIIEFVGLPLVAKAVFVVCVCACMHVCMYHMHAYLHSGSC